VFNLTGQLMSDRFRSRRLGPPLLTALLAAAPVQAQIVTDGSVGPKVSLRGGEIEIGANLGTQRGDNLFHSFEKFGIAPGQTATFTGPGAIRNVISRVTGGEVSSIDGTLASRVGQADLYFLNPAGVMFGPNAQLDVPGSFHVSTAHELRFANGARFSALDKTGSSLTIAPPEAFGFLGEAPKPIQVDRSQLRLASGKVLSLVGGDVRIDGGPTGSIGAEDGVVQLVSAAGSGVVKIANGTDDGVRRGAIQVTQQVPEGKHVPVIDVSGSAGSGTIRIRGGQVNLDSAWISADNRGILASTGGIDVQADNIEVRGGAISVDVKNAGRGGAIIIQAGDLIITDTATIQSITSSSGDAGAVRIEAGRLRVIGPSDATTPTGIASTTVAPSSGDGGSIMIKAGAVEIRGSGNVIAATQGAGNAGTIGIQADTMLLSGDTARRPARIDASVGSNPLGSGGAITIEARDLEVRDRGAIVSSTFGPGSAGQVTIKGGRVRIQGSPGTGINTATNPGSTGSGGSVTVQADSLDLRGSGVIVTSTFGQGAAGAITIDADTVTLSDPGAGIVSSAQTGSSGPGGPIEIKSGSLRLSNGAAISTRSQGAGRSGSITVDATDSLVIDGAGLSARTAVANADDIIIRVGRLFVMNQGQIITSVAGGKGSGGNITASVGEVGLSEGFLVMGSSWIVANALEGTGGNITLGAGQVVQSADTVISAASELGLSGQVIIQAPRTDLSASIRVLPDTFLNAANLVPSPCAVRGRRPASTLINGGRGGLPPDPSQPLHAHSDFSAPPMTGKAAGRDHIDTAFNSRRSGCRW
jgi:filamentous hemagglutinin family protein